MSKRYMVGDTLKICADDQVLLSVRESMDEDGMLMKLSGLLRNEIAHDFEDELMTVFSVVDKVRLDLAEVRYVGSVAMKALLSVQQMIDENDDKSFRIVALSGEVKDVFEEAGFMELFDIEGGSEPI